MRKGLTALLCTTVVTVMGASTLAAQQAQEEAQIDATQLADNVYMLTGQGGNLGLSVGPDGAFLIDDQFAPLHEMIVSKIEELAGELVDVEQNTFLLNTHFHPDHTDGNELMGAEGAVILAHENVRRRLAVEQVVPFFDMRHPALKPSGLPVLTFTRDVTLHLNGDEIEVFHVGGPAHTDGDAAVHFTQANVIHAGDIVFIGTYPFIDMDNGGSAAGVIAAVEKILARCDDATQIIPGHGPVVDKAGLTEYHAMLTETYAAVKALVESGKTLEEVQAAQPTAKHDAAWSTFIKADGYVSFLYRDLTGK